MAKSHEKSDPFLAYEMLSAQPVSMGGVTKEKRHNVIVSAISDDAGKEHVLSVYGDGKWNMSPYFNGSAMSPSLQKIVWPEDLPADLIDDAKAVVYAWLKRGTPGRNPPVGSTVCSMVIVSALPFISWLASHGIKRFSETHPIHIANYVHAVKMRSAKPGTVYDILQILDLAWMFRAELFFPFSGSPWGQKTLGQVSGIKNLGSDSGEGKTPMIPPDVQSEIFNYCEKVLRGASDVLDARDKGEVLAGSSKLIRIRDCALYIVLITSGMRHSEAAGIEADSWRSEIKDGVEYHWVGTLEHKTKKGKVEFLIPPSTLVVLNLMKRYALPFQKQLAEEAEKMAKKSGSDSSPAENVERLVEMTRIKESTRRLFIGLSKSSTGEKRIATMSAAANQQALTRLAKESGVSWKLAPHQCRRTYARYVVESRMGRKSLVFLKWQFKHTSISMTQLYASNPMQDASIFDEILQEMVDFKVDLIESWVGGQPLSGGAGIAIKKLRGIPIENRAAMLSDTAANVHIRATGHGWCLAQERGCGGAGLYEATRCAGCKSGVIDESFAKVWKGIYEQQIELLKIDDAGPAVKQRAQQDARKASQVLLDLGLEVPPEAAFEANGDNNEQ